jgi:hypothetical protein
MYVSITLAAGEPLEVVGPIIAHVGETPGATFDLYDDEGHLVATDNNVGRLLDPPTRADLVEEAVTE